VIIVPFGDKDFVVLLPSRYVVGVADGLVEADFHLAALTRGVEGRRDEVRLHFFVVLAACAVPILIASGLGVGGTLAPRLMFGDTMGNPSRVEVGALVGELSAKGSVSFAIDVVR
jgi:hypothetical protein